MIHAETEDEAADWLTNVLEDRLDLRVRQAAVDISTLDETIAEICADLSLSPDTAERWRDLPQAPACATPAGGPLAEEPMARAAGPIPRPQYSSA